MMFAGLRTGEVLALTWDNVVFKKKTITVNKGMTNEPKFDENGNITSRALIVSDTKTVYSVRTVPMPEILVDVLDTKYDEYRNKQTEEFYDQIEDDDLDLLLENLQSQKEKRKNKNKDFEM